VLVMERRLVGPTKHVEVVRGCCSYRGADEKARTAEKCQHANTALPALLVRMGILVGPEVTREGSFLLSERSASVLTHRGMQAPRARTRWLS
jgi:hypothetical protein